MDFNQETKKAVESIIQNKLPNMIEEKSSKMIEDIVSDIFRWGDTKNQIKNKIEEAINVNLINFDLIDYNVLIAKTINENLLQQINLQPIIDMTQDIVGFVNQKEISLEDIAEMFKEASKEDNYSDYEGHITFLVKAPEEYNWIEVFADIEPNKTEHDCSFKFIFSTEKNRDGKIFSFRTREKYFDTKQKEITASKIAMLSTLEHKIFRLYAAQVRIINYNDDISEYWDRD